MQSEWINTEVAKARKREIRENRRMLFPVRLVDFDARDDGISQTPTDYFAGYVSASDSQDALVAAILEVAQGGIYFCQGWRPNKKALSHRQGEVFKFIAHGKPVKEIASTLGLSAKTVEAHRSRIMDKLQIKDTAHLVRYAIRHGLLSAS
jgi:DNA-binding NarL/FixJ family response regulator